MPSVLPAPAGGGEQPPPQEASGRRAYFGVSMPLRSREAEAATPSRRGLSDAGARAGPVSVRPSCGSVKASCAHGRGS